MLMMVGWHISMRQVLMLLLMLVATVQWGFANIGHIIGGRV